MKLSIALLLALVLLVALDAPTPADAQRRRRRRVRRGTCRRSCRGFGGRFRSCSYCRPIVNCRRACSSRPRNFNRCVRRCRNVNRQVRRGRCYRRRGFTCRRAVAVQPVDVVTPVQPVTPAVGSAFLIPGQFNAATNFCSEQCYSDARFISAAQCDRRFCFVRSSCGAFPQYPQAGRCTAGGANTPITLPDARVCFGNCLLESQFTGQFACDGRVCELRPCGTSLAARRFSCVAQQPVTVAPTITIVVGMTPTPSPVVCPSACQSGVNAQVSFLTVQPTCPTTGCRIIRCTVQGASVTTLGHACVGPSVRGDAITSTPPSTETNFPAGQASVTPSPSPSSVGATGTTTVVSPSPSPSPSVTPSPSPSGTTTTTTVTVTPTATPSPTPSPTSTFSVTPSPTPVATSLSASEWDRCTITRGGTLNTQNNPAAPNGNPIDVTATIIGTAGATTGPCVVNLACRTNVTTVTCNTDGTIRVQITNAAQAAQLTLSQIYPRDCIFVYDRRRFGRPCVLNTFTSAANENQVQVAERMLRRRMAENTDVFMRIGTVTGTPSDATISGTEVGPMSMFAALTITNIATNRMLSTSRSESDQKSNAFDIDSTLRQVTVPVSFEEDDFDAQITNGALNVNFDGDINTEANTVDAVSISVVGGNVNAVYTMTRDFNLDYTMNFNNLGETQLRQNEILPKVSSNRTAFPNVEITPPGTCCRLPSLRFEEYIEVYPYLVTARGADGTISGSNWQYNADYPAGQWVVRTTGPVDNPSVTISNAAGLPIDLGPLPFTAAPLAKPATSGTLTINPSTNIQRADYQIDVDVGMIPALNLLFPTFVGSLQQKVLFFFDDRDGDDADDYTPGVGFTPADSAALAAPGTNVGCDADYDIRIFTSRREIDSQFVVIGTGGVQRTGAARTLPVSSMNSLTNNLDAVGMANFCFT